jgi:hypothetical protein
VGRANEAVEVQLARVVVAGAVAHRVIPGVSFSGIATRSTSIAATGKAQ